MSYNRGSLHKRIVRTTVPDRFLTVAQERGRAPPGHLSVTVTSSTVSANIEHHFIPVRDLTPANPMSSGQYCLVLRGELTGQIFWVKKCQSKKEPRGVELEDGTKLRFGDIYYVGLAVKILAVRHDMHCKCALDMQSTTPGKEWMVVRYSDVVQVNIRHPWNFNTGSRLAVDRTIPQAPSPSGSVLPGSANSSDPGQHPNGPPRSVSRCQAHAVPRVFWGWYWAIYVGVGEGLIWTVAHVLHLTILRVPDNQTVRTTDLQHSQSPQIIHQIFSEDSNHQTVRTTDPQNISGVQTVRTPDTKIFSED
ncbi:hypothetical protein BKA83DRAFT_4128437 [Pisolithus microcarpus]|nr:hypothetical protein BKA83DRAFT_4128437 [Pisolithus microcarpus]